VSAPAVSVDAIRAPATHTFDHAARLWLVAGCFMLAGSVTLLPAWGVDERTLNGTGLWGKPLKFWASLAIHFLTLGVLVRLVEPTRRTGAVLLAVAYVSVVVGILEVIYISLQAARGRASHFNLSTPLEGALYGLMGVGAVILLIASFAVGTALLRQGDRYTRPGLHAGAWIGLMTGSILTLIVAGTMSSGTSHFHGIMGSDANGLPVTGWSTRLPDLRPAHFVATHLMQALPLTGLLADRFVPGRARGIVLLATAIGVVLVAWLFGTALSGSAPLGFLG